MDIVVESVKLASKLHSRQRKKKSIVPDIPYMGHLMEVAGIVQSNGGDEITVAAALLHDAIEDQERMPVNKFVQNLGKKCSLLSRPAPEATPFPKPSWQERKETYLKLVETASPPVLLVIVADKLQNGRALLRRLKLEGAEGWGSPSRSEKLWYMQSLLEKIRSRLTQLERETNHPTLVSLRLLIDEYSEVIAAITHY